MQYVYLVRHAEESTDNHIVLVSHGSTICDFLRTPSRYFQSMTFPTYNDIISTALQ